jgi:hypothetical protein
MDFPYKREFINPRTLWSNARELDLVKITRMDQYPREWRVARDSRGRALGRWTGVMVVPEEAYSQVDILTEYFTETARMQARTRGNPSPLEYYNQNREGLEAQARELMERNREKALPLRYWLREAIYHNVKECNQFKITVTKCILRHYGARRVLDPSAGWGDRMLGAAAAGVERYLGVDPNRALRSGYDEIIEFLRASGQDTSLHRPVTKCEVITDGFLEAEIRETFDTVFTSPPFWDYEEYVPDHGDVAKQSITGISSPEEWLQRFLIPYVTKAWGLLEPGGTFAIYISDVPGSHYLEGMYRHITDRLRGRPLDCLAMATADLRRGFPVWVWRKPARK